MHRVVPELRSRGYRFVLVSELMGITREQAMPALSRHEQVINRINAVMFGTIFSFLKFLGIAFVVLLVSYGLFRAAVRVSARNRELEGTVF